MEWQPIETAPMDKWVLVYYAMGEMVETVSIAQSYVPNQDGWIDWDGDHYGKPTHWMPLPEPPRA